MVGRIKKNLVIFSRAPDDRETMCLGCIKGVGLYELLEKIKLLNHSKFMSVYRFAGKLRLPGYFKEDLEFEYHNRGFV